MKIVWGVLLFYLAIGVVAFVMKFIEGTRLDRARKEYRELEMKYGPYDARKHCPHRLYSTSQTGVPGVISITHKWCRICGADLGIVKR